MSRQAPLGGMALAPITATLAMLGGQAWASQPSEEPLTSERVAEMSIEDLMDLQVTSVAGVEQEWFGTPAAIDVITGEDVRRNGFRSLAEALRLAPGVFVGQTNSHAYSVGMRGFNGSLANKTLVLIDGRAVYDPLFGGTFWDAQDVLLDDLDRIEVIRGPGATLWGANAVNGVVNVITKSAKDTQGVVVSGGVGTYERAFGEARYGFKTGEDSWLRLYGKWFNRDHLVDAAGDSTHDDWDMFRGGFRFDHEHEDVTLTLQGDIYDSDSVGEQTRAPVPGQDIQFVNDIRDLREGGGNLLMRIGQEDEDQGWAFQAYYDRTQRVTNVQFQVDRDTFDLDWRHHSRLGANDFMWGVGARHTRDRTQDGYSLIFEPKDGEFTTFSAFVQDTLTLVPDRVFAMIGSKFSNNSYTGFEVQPSARVWWTPNDRNTLWASISRPVRVPSRTETEGQIVFGYIDTGTLAGQPPTGEIIPLGVQPNDELDAEQLLAYEAGYRVRLDDRLSIDTALFYNDYDRLIYVPTVLDPWNNDSTAETYGGELGLDWRPASNWRVKASYSYVDVLIHGSAVPADEGNTPHNQAQLHSYLDITKDLELNSSLYYVDNVPQPNVSAYLRLDLGITWRPSPNVELALWGQNLLDSQHGEFSRNEAQTSVYLQCTLRF